jgi:predicted transcriptional regulator
MNHGGFFMPLLQPVQPHHFKATLKKLRINQIRAASYLEISQSALSQYLLGYRPFPPELERKLAGLIEDAGQNTEATG